MKRILAVLVVDFCVATVVGCGGTSTTSTTKSTKTS